MSDVSKRMRADWNQRAREDAHYYVAFGSRDQDEASFLATGQAVVGALEAELRRLPERGRALEIGCGPGRLMKPLSRHFGEIYGVDVSDEMIGLARERLRDVPNAHVEATDGASLARFEDDSIDFVYSYAVFQHVPSKDVVREYMRETARVLKPGGIFRGQFNGLPALANPDTWGGVSFTAGEIREFTKEHGLRLLALEGLQTQYMWTTWRKPENGEPADGGQGVIRRITSAFTSEPLVPDRGRHAIMAIWITGLDEVWDINRTTIHVDGAEATPVYFGPADRDGLRQVNAMLPEGARTGLLPVELTGDGRLLAKPAMVRVIPAGPLIPRIVGVSDGINVIQENRTTTGMVKVHLEEIADPKTLCIWVDGEPVRGMETMCTDPLPPRLEVNFQIPTSTTLGWHRIEVQIGSRRLHPHPLQVDYESS
jgi:ubiquinone/menaquinone biosynthesis C-methylase UbiE